LNRYSSPAQEEAETLAAVAGAAAFRGRMAEARELARQAILAAEQRGLAGWSASVAEAQTLAEAMAGNTEHARDWLALTEKLGASRARLVLTPFLAAFSGAIDRAQALTEQFQGRFPKHTLINVIWLPSARATMALVRREPGVALDLLSRAKTYERGNLLPIYVRGQAYAELRMNREAAREFERLLELRGVEPMLAPYVPLAHVALGRTYGATGEIDKARRAYENFFALWKDADPDVPLLTAAREEYAALR
jgi:tetratricopeptide (TPR) repeat protein